MIEFKDFERVLGKTVYLPEPLVRRVTNKIRLSNLFQRLARNKTNQEKDELQIRILYGELSEIGAFEILSEIGVPEMNQSETDLTIDLFLKINLKDYNIEVKNNNNKNKYLSFNYDGLNPAGNRSEGSKNFTTFLNSLVNDGPCADFLVCVELEFLESGVVAKLNAVYNAKTFWNYVWESQYPETSHFYDHRKAEEGIDYIRIKQ